MRIWIILLLASVASAQVTAKHEVVTGTKIVEYVSQGKMVSADKTSNGKTVKLTVMDAEFAAIAKGRPIDTDKSVAACAKDLIATAKKDKTKIKVKNEHGTKTYDLEKEAEASVFASLVGDFKAGYKKDTGVGSPKTNEK